MVYYFVYYFITTISNWLNKNFFFQELGNLNFQTSQLKYINYMYNIQPNANKCKINGIQLNYWIKV